MEKAVYDKIVKVLNEELVSALGCTEPIMIAYASSVAKDQLEGNVVKIKCIASKNVIKNAKSVVVPNTSGKRGIKVSLVAGVVAGKTSAELEVIAHVSNEQINEIVRLVDTMDIEVTSIDVVNSLYLEIEMHDDLGNVINLIITDQHTHVIKMELNGQEILNNNISDIKEVIYTDHEFLNVDLIYEFTLNHDPKDIKHLIENQIKYNKEIADEGIFNKYGVGVARQLLKYGPDTIENHVKAFTASGSDARMSGSVMPVITNSGSGNQGMTCSNPIFKYCELKEICDEDRYYALVLADLVTIHIKTGVTRLSSYCGAMCAAAGFSAALMFLEDKNDLEKIKMAIINTLAIVSGIICDGANESCPAKIVSGIDAAFIAFYMALDGERFEHGCGIIEDSVEQTIKNVGILARDGMRETDNVILQIMNNIREKC